MESYPIPDHAALAALMALDICRLLLRFFMASGWASVPEVKNCLYPFGNSVFLSFSSQAQRPSEASFLREGLAAPGSAHLDPLTAGWWQLEPCLSHLMCGILSSRLGASVSQEVIFPER